MNKPVYKNDIEISPSKMCKLYTCIRTDGETAHAFFPGLKDLYFNAHFEDGHHAVIRFIYPKDNTPCCAYVAWYDKNDNELADISYGQSLGPFKFETDDALYTCEVGAVRTMKREHIPESIVDDFRNYSFLSNLSLKDIRKAIKIIDKELRQEESLESSR